MSIFSNYRVMSEPTCGLSCFRECGDKYDSHVLKKDMETVEKLSLKKLGNSTSKEQEEKLRIKKTASHSKLERFKCSTDRSKEEGGELALLRKKLEIEREI